MSGYLGLAWLVLVQAFAAEELYTVSGPKQAGAPKLLVQRLHTPQRIAVRLHFGRLGDLWVQESATSKRFVKRAEPGDVSATSHC